MILVPVDRIALLAREVFQKTRIRKAMLVALIVLEL